MKHTLPIFLCVAMATVSVLAYERPVYDEGLPWKKVEGPSYIYDNVLTAPFSGGFMMEMEVEVEEHPLTEGFFRVQSPYMFASDWGRYYQNDENSVDYLYLNAINPDEVFIADYKGEPLCTYNTHLRYSKENKFGSDYGYGMLECVYSHYLLQQDLCFDSYDFLLSYEECAEYAGKMISTSYGVENSRMIRFDDYALWGGLTDNGNYEAYPAKTWTLIIDGVLISSWYDIGDAMFTDGFVGQLYKADGYDIETYPVKCQANRDNPNLYRLNGLYGEGVWQWGNHRSLRLNLEVDVSDPEFVIIYPQAVFERENGDVRIANAAGLLTSGLLVDSEGNPIQYTKEDVLEEGLADKVNNNTITINHPVVITPEGRVYHLYNIDNFVPAVIVLPDGASVDGIQAVDNSDTIAEYYNLQGGRVMNPTNGLYIRRQGSSVEKVYIR